MQTIASLKAAGLQVKDAVVLIDREQGGRKNLKAEGYALHSVITLRHLLIILREQGRISTKQHNRALKSLR